MSNNKIQNHYLKIDKDLIKKYPNKSFKITGIKQPFRLCVTGMSGSGKSNVLIDLLHKQSGTYENIIFCVKNKQEPLYQQIQKDHPEIIWFENKIPNINEDIYKNAGPSVIIFDDQNANQSQKDIEKWFIFGRKVGRKKDGYHSVIYLAQNTYSIPKIIRGQMNYLILKTIGSKRDLDLILREYCSGIDINELKKMYDYCTRIDDPDDQFNFMKINIEDRPGHKIYKNYTELLG